MTDLSDAALRERAFKTILDWLQIEVCSLAECGTVEHETQQRSLLTDLFTHEFIAIRDAAKIEGAMEEAAKHADCCVAREEQLDAARAEERAKDGPLRSCPWCSEDQRGRIAHRQIDHLIACPAREDRSPTAPSGGGRPQDCEEARADADAVLDMIRQAASYGRLSPRARR